MISAEWIPLYMRYAISGAIGLLGLACIFYGMSSQIRMWVMALTKQKDERMLSQFSGIKAGVLAMLGFSLVGIAALIYEPRLSFLLRPYAIFALIFSALEGISVNRQVSAYRKLIGLGGPKKDNMNS